MAAPTLLAAVQGFPGNSGIAPYPFVGAFGTLGSQTNVTNTSDNGIAQSPDEAFIGVAIAQIPYVYVHAWDGTTLGAVVSNPGTAMPGAGTAIAWSPDGAYVAIASSAAPYVHVYAWSSAGFGSKVSDPGTALPGASRGVAWSPDGAYISFASDTTPYVVTYAWSAGFGAKVTNPTTLPAGAAKGVAWDPLGKYLAVVHTTTPYLTVYEFTSGAYAEKLTNPVTIPTGDGKAVAFNPAGTLLAVAHATTPFVSVYPFSGAIGTKLTNPTTLPAVTTAPGAVAFSPDGQYIAVGTDLTPFVRAWPIHPRDGFGTILTAPTTLPTASVTAALFSRWSKAAGAQLTRPTYEVQAQFNRRAFRKAVLALSPSSFWECEELTGTSIKDHLRAVTGTTSGSPTLGQQSRLESDEGYSILFDGSNDEISFGDNYDFPTNTAYTLMAIVEQSTYPSASNWPILGKFDAGVTNGYNVVIDNQGRLVSSRRATSVSDTATSTNALGPGKHLVVVTYDGATVTLYADGAAMAGGTVSSSRTLPGNAGNLYAGRNVGGTLWAAGYMQALGVWSGTALTANQIASLYTTYAAFGTDLRPYIEEPLSIKRGVGPDAKPLVGTLDITLDNEAGTFTPHNSSSSLYGLMVPYVPIRVRAKDNTTATWRPLWRGYVMEYAPDFPAEGGPTVALSCESKFGLLSRTPPATLTSVATADVDGMIATLLGAGGLRTTDYDLEDDAVNSYYAFIRYDESMLDQLAMMAIAELTTIPCVWEAPDGRVRFRAGPTLAGVMKALFRWGDGSRVQPQDVQEELRHNERISRVEFAGSRHQIVDLTSSVQVFEYPQKASTGDSPIIFAGQSIVIEGEYNYVSGTKFVTPAPTAGSNLALTGNTLANGTGTNKSSQLSCPFFYDGGTWFRAIIHNADAGSVYMTGAILTSCNPYEDVERTTIVQDPFFNDLQTPATLALESRYALTSASNAPSSVSSWLASALLLTRRNSVPREVLSFPWDSDDIQTQMLQLDLADLVAFKETGQWGTQADDYYRVESIEHTIPPIGDSESPGHTRVTVSPSWASAAGPMGCFDDFLRANISASLGRPRFTITNGWTTSAAWSIVSGAARPDASGARYAVFRLGDGTAGFSWPVVPTPCVDVHAKLGLANLLDAGASFIAGLIYRWVDANNYWRVVIDRANLLVKLIRKVGASDTTVATYAWTLEATAELRVIAQANRHRVYLNGGSEPVIDTLEDAGAMLGEYVGLYGDTATTVDFKTIIATGLN